MKKINWFELLAGAVVTLMTAAIIGVFTQVSKLTESDIGDQIRLERHDRDIAQIRWQIARLQSDVVQAKIDAARAKSACDEWARRWK